MSDIVELVMAVEAAFDVEIADEQAEQIETVGQLRDFLAEHFRRRFGAPTSSVACLNLAAFSRVRRTLLLNSTLPRREIRPSTSLEIMLPPLQQRAFRRRTWDALRRGLGVELPRLEHGKFVGGMLHAALCFLLFGFPLGVFFAVMIFDPQFQLGMNWIWIHALFVGAVIHFGGKLFEPLATRLPDNASRVDNLVEFVTRQNFGSLVAARGSWSEDELWRTLRSVVAEATAIELHKIQPQSRFVDDLNLD